MTKRNIFPAILIVISFLELFACFFMLAGRKSLVTETDNATVCFLNIFAMVITIIMMLSAYIDAKEKRYGNFFLLLFFINLELFLTVFYMFVDGMKDLAVVNLLVNTLFMGISVTLLHLFMKLVNEVGSSKLKSDILDKTIRIIVYIGYLAMAGNIFLHYIFVIDDDGLYHRTHFYDAWMVLTALILVLLIVKIITQDIKGREKVQLLTYIALPVLAIAIREIFGGPFIQYIACVCSLLIIYANIYIKRGEALRKQQLQLMVSQIQPHFVFNALSSIRQLCNDEVTADLILDFSNYIRMNFDTLSNDNLVPLEKELEHTRQYVRIESLRFGDRMSVIYDIEDSDIMLPPLSLQPIVENAIKHGICEKVEGGTVSITGRSLGNYYELLVEDDGVGFDVNTPKNDGREHVGVKNVKSRIENEINGKMTIESTSGVGTKVKFILPVPEKGEKR